VENTKLAELELHIPITHACFADHFPENQLVPGALLLKWTLTLLEEHLQLQIKKIKQAKFLLAVRPGDKLKLQIQYSEKKEDPSLTRSITITAYLNNEIAIKGQCEAHHE
jgi:3-hydroxymyristoyl/3-hydroxydecanoyl-(acyl carrier protein) dehydratase